jgi:hypothetical protein
MKRKKVRKRDRYVIPKERLAISNVTPILKVITLLDGYRINRFKDPIKIGKMAKSGAMGSRIKNSWDKIYKVLWDLTSLTSNIPKAVKNIKYYSIANVGTGILFSFSMIMFIVAFLLNFPLVVGGGILISLAGVLILLRSYFSKQIATSVDEYVRKNPDKFNESFLFLKNFVQQLILDLKSFFKFMRINPSNHPFHIYNMDYTGMAIIKSPSRRRKSMVGEIKID